MYLSSVKAVLAGACLLLFVPPAQAQKSQNFIWCENEGDKFPLDRQIGACTAIIQSGKEDSQNLASAFNNRGSAYKDRGDYDRAIADFNQAIRLDPKDATAFSNRGMAYGRKGQYDRAIEDFDQAIRLDSKFAAAFNNRGKAYELKGQHDRAIENYSEAIRFNPKYDGAFKGRCWNRAIAGRELREALEDCNTALGLTSEEDFRAVILDSRGLVHIKLGQFDAAIADYSAATRIDPKLASALYGRGYARQKKGDTGGGADIAAAKALRSDIADVYAKNGLK